MDAPSLFPVRVQDRYAYVDAAGNVRIAPRFDVAGPLREGLAAALDASDYSYVYVDRAGAVAVRPQDRCVFALPFTQGLAAAMLDVPRALALAAPARRSFGYLDRRGAWAIAPRFDQAGSFRHGIARVQLQDRFGFIDARGEPVIAIDLTWASECVDGVALGIRGGRCHAFRADGSVFWHA